MWTSIVTKSTMGTSEYPSRKVWKFFKVMFFSEVGVNAPYSSLYLLFEA